MQNQPIPYQLRVRTQVRAAITKDGCPGVPKPEWVKTTWDRCTQECDADNRCRYLQINGEPTTQDMTNYFNGYVGCVNYWCQGQYGLSGN